MTQWTELIHKAKLLVALSHHPHIVTCYDIWVEKAPSWWPEWNFTGSSAVATQVYM